MIRRTQSAPVGDTYGEACALHRLGRLDQARRGFEQVLRRQPDHDSALMMLGLVKMQLREIDAAIVCLDRAVALNSCSAMAQIYRAVAYAGRGQYDVSLECYDRAIAIDPTGNALPHYSRANILLRWGRFDEALRGFEQALRIGSAVDAEAFLGCGLAQRRL